MIVAARSAAETYRTVEFDARVTGASGPQLADICYEHLIGALGSAMYAQETGDTAMRSRSLSRAVSSLLALEMGVTGQDGMAATLRDLYGRARTSVLSSVLAFDAAILTRIRNDFIEIREAMRAGQNA